MDALIIENVRCFRHPPPVPLAPLTLLVGENSTGKTTFLALTRLAWEIGQGPITPDFNAEPFLLGAFSEIASYAGGRAGRAKSFKIGLKMTLPGRKSDTPLFGESTVPRTDEVCILATFGLKAGQPHIQDWRVEFGQYGILASADAEGRLGNGSPTSLLAVSNGALLFRLDYRSRFIFSLI